MTDYDLQNILVLCGEVYVIRKLTSEEFNEKGYSPCHVCSMKYKCTRMSLCHIYDLEEDEYFYNAGYLIIDPKDDRLKFVEK